MEVSYTSELYHHGILGQKWGVRRYQNSDGSLTNAGKKHYSKNRITTDDDVAFINNARKNGIKGKGDISQFTKSSYDAAGKNYRKQVGIKNDAAFRKMRSGAYKPGERSGETSDYIDASSEYYKQIANYYTYGKQAYKKMKKGTTLTSFEQESVDSYISSKKSDRKKAIIEAGKTAVDIGALAGVAYLALESRKSGGD